jgi:hypothetical protein
MKTTNTNPLRRHDNTDFVYRNPRPALTVENNGGANLGNCYNASYFVVTSLRPLDMEDLLRLRECGFLGYGQEFMCKQVIGDSTVRVPERFNPGKYVVGYRGEEDEKFPKSTDTKPSGTDMVPCLMVDRVTRKVIEGQAINPYSGLPYEPNEQSYYVYHCESRVDSSD